MKAFTPVVQRGLMKTGVRLLPLPLPLPRTPSPQLASVAHLLRPHVTHRLRTISSSRRSACSSSQTLPSTALLTAHAAATKHVITASVSLMLAFINRKSCLFIIRESNTRSATQP